MTVIAMNRQVLLASRPDKAATLDNFRIVETPLPTLADGQVLIRHRWLSLDPYMRARMDDRRGYATPQALDAVMIGGTAGEVVESRNPHFAVGDNVVGMGGWQQYAVVDAKQRGVLQKVDTSQVPLSAWLGAVGMPGVTAWYGLTQIIAPKEGATVVVSAASGAVGSVVGQLAKVHGCRAVGIAGGPDKCAYVGDTLGFDACVDYKAHAEDKALGGALKAACPDGIDGYFDNVGGRILDAAMVRMNAFGRIAMCGVISTFDGPPVPMAHPQLILVSRLLVQGFIVSEHMQLWPQAQRELAGLIAEGRLKYRESIAEGIDAAPAAFLGMLKGRNFGKQLVRLA